MGPVRRSHNWPAANCIRVLCIIEAVEVLKQAKVLEWGLRFRWQLWVFADLIIETLGHVFIRASKGKIINLAQQEYLSTLESSGIY